MEPQNNQRILGLSVYIPLILAVFFLFLAFAAGNSSTLNILGFIPNPFYTSDPSTLAWNIPGIFFTVVFGFLGIATLLSAVVIAALRASKNVLNQESKPTSRRANIIAAILIILIIIIVWAIYKFGIH
jgi:hypothetical protein